MGCELPDKVSILAEATAYAEIDALEVTGDLFGRQHCFTHDDRNVTITLPFVELGSDLQPLERYQNVASYRSGWVDDHRPEVTTYQISHIEVSIKIEEEIKVPPKLLAQPPKHPEIAGQRLSKRLDAMAIGYEARLASAVKHWEEVYRWISGSSALGAPTWRTSREAEAHLSGMALVVSTNKQRFWTPTHTTMSLRGGRADAAIWDAIGSALMNGYEAPIWFRYTDEAHHRLLTQDFNGALLSSAIACETIARECFWLASGATSNEAVRDLMDRVSISGMLDKWPSLVGLPKSDLPMSELRKLFTRRNRLMHAGGKGAALDRAEAETLSASARTFVLASDEWYFARRGIANPRVLRHVP